MALSHRRGCIGRPRPFDRPPVAGGFDCAGRSGMPKRPDESGIKDFYFICNKKKLPFFPE